MCALCNAAWECPSSRGRATDTREKESPLPVYDPKVEGRVSCPGLEIWDTPIYGFRAVGMAIGGPSRSPKPDFSECFLSCLDDLEIAAISVR
ncbi:hypothetical protein CRG98_016833 [Punica granatum]|uniref:Uncharacterized protein n=1 Tax=Punica granatum TaxID=22663 RepID=A0A2I0K2J5_PUNGR|nr:hypothetical protein CRG98_016833 [Punica granatum]